MPDQYRAPEVVLGLSWSYPVDVWALGSVIWELFEGRWLFDAMNPDKVYSERYHLAEIMAILGPLPPDLILRARTECENIRLAKKGEKFWDGDGRWIYVIPIPNTSLETAEHRLESEEKRLFLVFMRKMLQWRPEDRLDCHSLYHDEWLCGDLIEAGLVYRDSLANAISEKCQDP